MYFQKSGYFSKKMFFPNFRLIQSVFWSIEILFKNFSEPLSGSIDRTDWSNLFFDQSNIVNQVLKNSVWTCSNHFFKNFSNLFLSLGLDKAPQRIFCRFLLDFLQGFSLPKPVCLFYPSFCIVFLIFMHNPMVFG